MPSENLPQFLQNSPSAYEEEPTFPVSAYDYSYPTPKAEEKSPVAVSAYDCSYPTPEQCRQILASISADSPEHALVMPFLKRKSAKASRASRSKVPKQPTTSRYKNMGTPAAKLIDEKQRRKERMCFPKSTFLLRYADLANADMDFIWCVDNHQLLVKYLPDPTMGPMSNLRTYTKTDRYAGWLCDEYWNYFPLNGRVEENENKITVDFPNEALLRKYREQKLAQRLTEQQQQRQQEGQLKIKMEDTESSSCG